MKKITTLIASVMLFAVSFAQYNSENSKGYDQEKERESNKDIARNDNRYSKDYDRNYDRNGFNYRERDMKIANINRDYDRRIHDIQRNWMIGRNRKNAITNSLEEQRRREIGRLIASYKQPRGHHRNRDSRRNW